MAVSQKIPIEFHANCYGITNWYCGYYHLQCLMFDKKKSMFFSKCPYTTCRFGTALLVALSGLRIVRGMFTKLCSTYEFTILCIFVWSQQTFKKSLQCSIPLGAPGAMILFESCAWGMNKFVEPLFLYKF